MTHDFSGRVVLVTGAYQGLGRATAARFLAQGAQVVVNVRDGGRAGEVATALGPGVMPVPGDVSRSDEIGRVVGAVLEAFGRLDILVNNAAAALTTRFLEISEEEWRLAMDVNLTAPFLLTQAVTPAMKSRKFGRIINVSSTAGKSVSTLGGAHYTASKTALLGLTRAAARELGPYGITVNAICPGLFDTELTRRSASVKDLEGHAKAFPIPRLGEAVEVADLICYLASEEAGYITGASIDINGGDLMV